MFFSVYQCNQVWSSPSKVVDSLQGYDSLIGALMEEVSILWWSICGTREDACVNSDGMSLSWIVTNLEVGLERSLKVEELGIIWQECDRELTVTTFTFSLGVVSILLQNPHLRFFRATSFLLWFVSELYPRHACTHTESTSPRFHKPEVSRQFPSKMLVSCETWVNLLFLIMQAHFIQMTNGIFLIHTFVHCLSVSFLV